MKPNFIKSQDKFNGIEDVHDRNRPPFLAGNKARELLNWRLGHKMLTGNQANQKRK
jgi:hypothetical protein